MYDEAQGNEFTVKMCLIVIYCRRREQSFKEGQNKNFPMY